MGGVKRLVWTIVVILAVIGAALASYLTPMMSVRSIDVSGTQVLDPAQIVATSQIRMGTPLLQVDTTPAAQRIAAIPRVKSVRVARSYPSGIDITVEERVAVAFVARNGQWHLVDVDGVDFARQKALPRLPRLTDDRSTDTASDKSALSVVAGLPADLRARVTEVGVAGVTLTLAGGKKVIWGDDEDGAAKARTLGYLLTQDGTEYNVSAPLFPTFR